MNEGGPTSPRPPCAQRLSPVGVGSLGWASPGSDALSGVWVSPGRPNPSLPVLMGTVSQRHRWHQLTQERNSLSERRACGRTADRHRGRAARPRRTRALTPRAFA